MSEPRDDEASFTAFVAEVEPRLRRALVAVCGPERSREAVQEALGYAWEHWERVREMSNPSGYLYRVARSRIDWPNRREVRFPAVVRSRIPDVEPGLPDALSRLTERQRVVVFLVVGCDWSYDQASELLGVSVSSVRTHLDRGLERLRVLLGVTTDV